MPRIDVHCNAGRTLDQKRQLVKGITDAVVSSFNVRPDQVTVVIHEQAPENRAKGGILGIDAASQ